MNIAMGVRGNKERKRERKGGREGWKMESSR